MAWARVCGVAALGAGAVACAGGARTAPGDVADADVDAALPGDAVADAASFDLADSDAGADGEAGPDFVVVPAAGPDASCVVGPYQPAGLVCFGDAAAPYDRYLSREAGVGVGQCPTTRDFIPPRGEGAPCGYNVCGPLLPSAARALADDAGVPVDDSGSGAACCFIAIEACGV
jgi:hypothetical protein